MTVSVFVGTSLDGFLARRNGALDFLPADGGSDNGFDDFLAMRDRLDPDRVFANPYLRRVLGP